MLTFTTAKKLLGQFKPHSPDLAKNNNAISKVMAVNNNTIEHFIEVN